MQGSSNKGKGEQMGAVMDGRWSQVIFAWLGWTLALLLAAAVASAAEEPEYELKKSFGPDGTVSTEFTRPGPIAIDQQTHIAYVLDRGTGILYKFDAEGNVVPFTGSAPYISGNKISGLLMANTGERQVAADSTSHEFYVTDGNSIRAFQASGEPALFSAGPGSGTNLIGGFDELAGLAVDANGFIYASEKGLERVRIFDPSGEEVTQFAVPGEPRNLAVDSSGTVYVTRFLATTLKYTPSSFPVTDATTYTAAAEPVSEFSMAVAVDPENDDVYVTHFFPDAKVAVYDKEGILIATFAGNGEEGELIQMSEGIALNDVPGKKGDSVLASRFPGPFGPGIPPQVEIFEISRGEVAPPTIESTAASSVTADSATLHARINPNLAETTYWFEYGLEDCAVSACTKVPLGGATLAEGADPVAVSQPIAGLEPGTTYHYRVVAENELSETQEPFGPTESPDKTFKTQAESLSFDLADSRTWEMVSPPDKSGSELMGTVFEGVIQAAADGNGLAYLSYGSIEAAPDGNRAAELSTVLARRGGSGGWTSKDITPASGNVAPITSGQVFKLFTPDLARALLVPHAMNPLSPDATERTPYIRENTEPPTYIPLVTGKEGVANVPPGTEFGGLAKDPDAPVQIRGSNVSQSDVVLRSGVPLAAGAPNPALYHWRGGALSPLSVLPTSEGGGFVSAQTLGGGRAGLQGAVSEDGARIFWSLGTYGGAGNLLTALYVRDTEAEETGRLDVVSGGSGAGAAKPAFVGASADGTVAYFTDTQQLTADASPSGADLYRCEVAVEAIASGCASLTNISGSAVALGKSAEVLGLPLALSEDGRTIYFVATGVLDAEPNPQGDSAEEGEPNLYLWEEGDEVRFIATLAEEDERSWGKGGTPVSETNLLSASGSPSGRYLTFMSQESLTGEDNVDPVSGEKVERVFAYDAVTDGLQCISCDPDGAAPAGEIVEEALLADPRAQWEDRRVGAIVPQPGFDLFVTTSLYKPRAVLDSGRIFFNAIDPIVPADSNGQWDVYEYEPLGVGSCTTSSGDAGTARSGEGCVSLLSSGTAKEEVGFLDASVSGDDVFFLTQARLSVLDKDDDFDVYDARVNGIEAVLEPEAGCVGEGCRSAAPPPSDSTPSSATFQGAGNLKEGGKTCPKGKKKAKRKGKTVCVAKKKPKKQKAKAKKQKQAGQSGRAGR
jgi:DNA-binding beta-propeller fold protein YncE